jgi:hypothetical protein
VGPRAVNEIYAYIWYYSFLSPPKSHGIKSHKTDSQNSDTTEPSGRELYHLQFSLQAASPETFRYTVVSGEVLQNDEKRRLGFGPKIGLPNREESLSLSRDIQIQIQIQIQRYFDTSKIAAQCRRSSFRNSAQLR